MAGPKVCHTQWSKSEREKQILFINAYIWNLEKWYESASHSVMSDSLWPHGLYSPWNSPGHNTGMSSHSLLQGIFPTQGSNPGLLHCRWILYQLSHKGNPPCYMNSLISSTTLWGSCHYLLHFAETKQTCGRTWFWTSCWSSKATLAIIPPSLLILGFLW